MDLCHVPATREKGWYLALMAPNVKGPNYAWLDPSRLYCHPQVPSARGGWHPPGARVGCISTGLLGHPAVGAHGGLQAPSTSPLPQGLQDCVADLLQPFQGDAIDMVAGIDAMGFILGAAAAATLQKGFLAIRKAGHLCVQTAAQPYSDYSGRGKVMEVRTDAITPGLRILLVDQWVETGGTMRAAIELVERLGGVVAVSLPVCPHRCRCHLHGEQRGREVDPGALQVLPLCPPLPAAPLRPAPLGLGLMWDWHLVCPQQPPRGTQGCWLCRTGMLLGGRRNSSSEAAIHPLACP
uniref:adenine phosphoribosyltransferase n=1 Tax=Ficedula albicollis TaxID=59894 RepID=A0A803V0U2_FICAL